MPKIFHITILLFPFHRELCTCINGDGCDGGRVGDTGASLFHVRVAMDSLSCPGGCSGGLFPSDGDHRWPDELTPFPDATLPSLCDSDAMDACLRRKDKNLTGSICAAYGSAYRCYAGYENCDFMDIGLPHKKEDMERMMDGWGCKYKKTGRENKKSEQLAILGRKKYF